MFLEEESVIMTTLNTCDCTHQFDTLNSSKLLFLIFLIFQSKLFSKYFPIRESFVSYDVAYESSVS